MTPELTDVPETMLWTLHNRASEARRPDTAYPDPEAVRIYEALTYDYERSFGPAEPSHAVRSAMFDAEVRTFVDRHPNAVLVHLGEGLETQRFRVDGPETTWLTVDLPEAIAIRERFIDPDARHLHIACSATDPAWLEAVPPGRPVLVTAQGLLMYLPEDAVRGLFQRMAERLPGAVVVFDSIPPWLSKKTLSAEGWQKTSTFTTPPMPWGIARNQLPKTLERWVAGAVVEDVPWWSFPRGVGRWVFPVVSRLPGLRNRMPAITRVQLP